MRQQQWHIVVLMVLAAGCARNPEPAKGPDKVPANPELARSEDIDKAPDPTDAIEPLVRATIADKAKIDPASIPLDRPMSEPPVSADDLDLLVMVMSMEERLGVNISDDAISRYGGGIGAAPIRITPRQLMAVTRESVRVEQSKKRK